jgi:hypothetical protein
MEPQPKERWIELCEQVTNETDQVRLTALLEEITLLLDEKLANKYPLPKSA